MLFAAKGYRPQQTKQSQTRTIWTLLIVPCTYSIVNIFPRKAICGWMPLQFVVSEGHNNLKITKQGHKTFLYYILSQITNYVQDFRTLY